jgi:hypothetical protein
MRSKNGCPICGHPHQSRDCNPRVLAGIDGAHSRAWNELLDPRRTPPERRSYNHRLREGFLMLQDDDLED